VPELPEVEIAARNLRAWGVGRKIEGAEADRAARYVFRPARPAAVVGALVGRRVESVRRVGKHLLVELSGPDGALGLLSHLGMTGKWLRRGAGEAAPEYSRARLHLDDGATLHYRDPRLFGRLRLVPGARFEEVKEVAALGPDPLERGIDAGALAEALARRRIPVKVAIMDQAILPGVGNILASEALFRARIDPRRKANGLARAEVKRVADAVLAAVNDTIARELARSAQVARTQAPGRRVSAAWEPEIEYVEEPGAANPFLVYDREGERCPRCKREPIRRVVQAGRSTYFCPRCQR
jgi:formamidopyrimidine-DNA glycosylase